MSVSFIYPIIDFPSVDYDKIPIGAFLIGFDSNNLGYLSKMDHFGTITVIEGTGGGGGGSGEIIDLGDRMTGNEIFDLVLRI